MQDTTIITARPTTVTLADGTYTWIAVTAWAGQPMRAVVGKGRITAWEYAALDGSGDTMPAIEGADLESRNAELMAALAHEVAEYYRLRGLIRPVEFVPAAEAPRAPTPAIGNPAAHKLHVAMGKLRIPNHYDFATEALDLAWPVESLAALTEREAVAVWQALSEYAAARVLAEAAA